MDIALAVKDQRIDTATQHLNELYVVFQIFGALAAIALVLFAVRDSRIRAHERGRQQSIDEIVKELLGFQRTASLQQLTIGEARASQEQANVGEQLAAIQKVNAVIEVVRRTLDFRQQQEARVTTAFDAVQGMTAKEERSRQQKLSQAITINKNFSKMSRMHFAALSDEQRKRGLRLVQLARDLELTASQKDFELMGEILLTCGAVSYYDNDVITAKEYFDQAADCRSADHQGTLDIDDKYRKRFGVIHYFRALVHKNWGELPDALHEIEQSVKLFTRDPTEFLSPVTRLEILSYFRGDEIRCRVELQDLLERANSLETALKATGQTLNANQFRLRNRMLVLLGNTYFVQRSFDLALRSFAQAETFSKSDYYALAPTGQCLAELGRSRDAAAQFAEALAAIERSGDLQRKRELTTRVGISVIAALCARGSGDSARFDLYSRDARATLATDLSVDGMAPKFFSPSSKRLSSQEELLGELNVFG